MNIPENVKELISKDPGLLKGIESNRQEFIKLLDTVTRNGINELLSWLDSSDFFYAPASTKYHLSRPGGLCEHSLNVYKNLKFLCPDASTPFSQSLIVVGLLHDVCKANYYTISLRNSKNSEGIWEKVPYYTTDDKFPFGHGEKSVYLLSNYIDLDIAEIMAIRWHMGGFETQNLSTMSLAYSKYPLAVLLHSADLISTYVTEDKVTSKQELKRTPR